jgi:hypothetical protein
MADKRDEEIKEVVFGKKQLDPEQEEAYRKQIAEARKGGLSALKGHTPLGHVPRPPMPDLSQASGNIAEMPAGLSPDGGVQPRPPGSPLLSAQTKAQLEKALQNQVEGEKKEEVKKEVEKKAEAEEDLLAAFDFSGLNEADRILNNRKRRAEIEARCSPMKFEDLMLFDEIKQTVPIRADGQFTVVYRSLKPDESLFLKEYMAKKPSPNESWALEKFALMQLACSIVKINDTEWPNHLNKDGDPEVPLFEAKLRKLTRKSGYIAADLSINYGWFDIRIRKLLAEEGALGNG